MVPAEDGVILCLIPAPIRAEGDELAAGRVYACNRAWHVQDKVSMLCT